MINKNNILEIFKRLNSKVKNNEITKFNNYTFSAKKFLIDYFSIILQ